MKKIKLSKKNLGRKVKVNGLEHELSFVSADKEKFRIKVEIEKEGISVTDYTFDDIEEADELVISIK